MYGVTLRPGSWPPSPGFEPCAILISSCRARARYSAVTPNRADATCLMWASVALSAASGAYQAGSSPPSPVLAEPPMAWIPSVSARCASGDNAPTLIALTTNRRAIERESSTSSSGTARVPRGRETRNPSRTTAASRPSPARYRASAVSVGSSDVARSCTALAIAGLYRWSSPSPRNLASPGSGSRSGRAAAVWARAAASRDSCTAARSRASSRPGHAAAAGKQRATRSGPSSIVSNSWPPM